MYAYRFVDSAHREKAPARLQALDNTVRNYFDTSRDLKKHPVEMLIASTVYMWDPRSPLNIYMHRQFKKDSATGVTLKKWASMAPLYADYGSYIMRKYPMTFLKNYLLPNATKYYAPPEEFLDSYNMGVDSISGVAQNWFKYKSNKVKTVFKDLHVNSLGFLPILSGIMNVVFLFGFIAWCLLKKIDRRSVLSGILLLTVTLWLVNFSFSVFASPITLRYQLFGILVFGSFAFLLVDRIYTLAFIQKD